jgi:hypothetical protein
MPDSANALTPALSRSTGRGGQVLQILSWAIFLGVSWTWCVGMYLPVILVRDYGIWAFVVFAVPNVVGAAAMAWVLPDADSSRKLEKEHRTACALFSLATLSFHVFFFIAYLANWFYAWLHHPLVLACVFIGMLVVISGFPATRYGTLIVLAVSYWAAAKMLLSGTISLSLPSSLPAFSRNVIYLAPVCIFGFALCPYLDRTFHRARQETSPTGGRFAFGIGFGLFFFSMILFTLCYSPVLMDAGRLSKLPAFLVLPLAVHLVAQTTWKLFLHTVFAFADGCVRNLAVPLAIIASGLLGAYCIAHPNAAELVYRCFMSLYGLLFPAYVWICVVRRHTWVIWLISVLLATPMYWMGFIEGQTAWLLPGVGIVLLAGTWQTTLPVRREA